MIAIYPGANQTITDDEVAAIAPELTTSDVLLVQLENNFSATLNVIKLAHALGKKVILNPAPYSSEILPYLDYLDVITPNETEASLLSGIDALVLVTNHLDPQKTGSDTFFNTLNSLLDALPESLPLGLYECPAPYRRLLSDEELTYCANTSRFVVLKDVSCDLDTVTRRVKLVQDTPLNIINANAAIAVPPMNAGFPPPSSIPAHRLPTPLRRRS